MLSKAFLQFLRSRGKTSFILAFPSGLLFAETLTAVMFPWLVNSEDTQLSVELQEQSMSVETQLDRFTLCSLHFSADFSFGGLFAAFPKRGNLS